MSLQVIEFQYSDGTSSYQFLTNPTQDQISDMNSSNNLDEWVNQNATVQSTFKINR